MAYTGPGDLQSFTFWGGLRAYSAADAAAGNPCVTVRRSSDNATQNINVLSTGDLDVASATSFAGGSNLFINKLFDKGTGGNNLGQSTAANQPQLFLNGGQNNAPYMQFTSASIALASSGNFTPATGKATLVTVANRVSGTGSSKFMVENGTGGGANRLLATSAVANQWQVNANSGTLSSGTVNDNAWHAGLGVINSSGSTSILNVDGVEVTNTTLNPNTTAAPINTLGVASTTNNLQECGFIDNNVSLSGSARTALINNMLNYAPTVVSVPKNVYDLQSPLGAAPPYPNHLRTWLNPGLALTAGIIPFNQKDWPNPLGNRLPHQNDLRTWAAWYNLNLIGQDNIPPINHDWPLPRGLEYPLFQRTWINPGIMQVTPVPPSNNYDWPLPGRAFQPDRSYILPSFPPFLLTGPQPFNEYDWPNPYGPAYHIQFRTWINQGITSVPPPLPLNNYDWPLPKVAAQPDRSLIQPSFGPFLLLGAKPFNQQDWPLAPRDLYPYALRAFSNTGPAYLPSIMPFFQTDWPLPGRAQQPDRSFLAPSFGPRLLQGAKPFNQQDWPLPGTPYYPNSIRVFASFGTIYIPPVVVVNINHHDMPVFASFGQFKSW